MARGKRNLSRRQLALLCEAEIREGRTIPIPGYRNFREYLELLLRFCEASNRVYQGTASQADREFLMILENTRFRHLGDRWPESEPGERRQVRQYVSGLVVTLLSCIDRNDTTRAATLGFHLGEIVASERSMPAIVREFRTREAIREGRENADDRRGQIVPEQVKRQAADEVERRVQQGQKVTNARRDVARDLTSQGTPISVRTLERLSAKGSS